MKETLWEEKNLIEPQTNCESSQISVPNDITNDTKNEFVKKECKNIGVENLTKQCPKCNKFILYKNKKCLDKSTKNNQLCRSCSRSEIKFGPMTNEHKEKIRNHHIEHGVGKWMVGKRLSKETKEKLSKIHTGKTFSKETKEKMSLSKIGDKNPAKNIKTRIKISNFLKINPRVFSEETRRKISIKSKINMMKKYEIFGKLYKPVFNPTACEYFNKLNEENGWNLQHALNGGEKRILCYWVDAYDKEKNIVVEYDEPRHYNVYGKLIDDDSKRMLDIINHLGCKFYRYNEELGVLKKYDKQNETIGG